MALLTSYWVSDCIILFLSAIVAGYLYMTRKFNYWNKKGVKELAPTPFVGNFADFCLFKRSPGELLRDLYEKSNGLKYLGFYIFDKPFLLLRDPEIIKHVLVKDFNYFVDRHVAASEDDALGNANLFVIKSPHWKGLRSKLTPSFTSGKIKKMFDLMVSVGNDLDTHLQSLRLDGAGRTIEVTDTCARYTTDIIGTVAYGLQVNCLNNPEAEFRECGRKIFGFSYRRWVELSAIFFTPGLVRTLGFKFFGEESSDFLRKVFSDTINVRIESGVRRNDFIDTLIELKKNQQNNDDPNAFKFDGDNLVAQAAIFFTAGYETSSTTLSFTLYEMALQPEVQNRLRDEINAAIELNDGQITYDLVKNLAYLDMVVSETLRKYPPLPFLDRVAAADYQLPGTDLAIERGTPIYIPIYGLHYDPNHYPDPEKYDPERFSEENKRKRPSYVYMPFGEGPHSCIGIRLGLLQVKLGLMHIISKYEITPCEKTLIPMRLEPKAIMLTTDGGLFLNLRKIPTQFVET